MNSFVPAAAHRPIASARLFLCLLGLASFLCIPALSAQAGTVTGTVTNGTTNKPAAGVQMILIQLQGGMQPVDNTKTDANGHYQFTNAGLGGQMPMLIRAVYHDVFYHQPVAPGKTTADVTVYEPTSKPGSVSVTTHVVILQPNGPNSSWAKNSASKTKRNRP